MTEKEWVFVVKVIDKPGVLSAIAAIFSNRGISLETILGSILSPDGVEGGRIVVKFRATERKQEMLLRAAQRLSKVLEVQAYPYADERLRAIAIAKVKASTDLQGIHPEIQMEVISSNSEHQTVLLTGPTLIIDSILKTLKEQNTVLDIALAVMAV
ncbi:MAG: ACT domain-containing protein [Microcoleaceae cyanobacterium]